MFGGLTNGYNSKTVGMGAPLGDNYPNDWWCHGHSGQGDFGVKTFYNQGDTDLCVGYVYDPCWNGGNVLYQNASGVRGDLGDADRTENNYSGCSWHNMWISLSSYLGGSNGYMSISFEGNGDYCSRDIYFGYKKSEIGSVTDGINSTWCCDQSTDCVDDAPAMGGGNSDIAGIGSGCYNTNTTHDADGDGDLDVCSSGSWIDCTSDSHCKNHFKCAAPTCYSSCSSNSQCVSGYYCSGSACIPILPNGLACNENSDCASGNCRKEIDSSNYFCAAAGKACSEGVSGHEGYSAGSLGSYGNPSWLCSATDTSYQCNAANKCKTYNSRYCDGVNTWNSGTGAGISVTGCNAYSCGSSVLVVRDACNGSGACATRSVLVTTCGGGENSSCVAGQSTCQNLCSNSVDDDGDGYKDAQDSDCGGCSQCTSGACCNTSTGCYYSSSTVCRTAADLCDEVENCTGSSASCPSDALKPTGTVCRAAAGPCDVAETCIAGAPYCPQDVKLSGKQSCSTCQYCNGSSATCQYMASGSDTYGDCGTTGCYTGNCDGAGACAYYLSGQRNCATCQQCNASGTCVNITSGTDPYTNCGLCEYCDGGACVNVAIGEDPKNDCPFDDCKTGLCSGSGYCAYYTSGEQECPECQACSSSGVCVNAETLACPQDRMYCSDTNNRLCGAKEPGEVCCVLKSWGCFTADTMIKTTWGGDKKINKIRVGDLVQGYDTEKKQIKEVEVNNVFKHEKQNYYSIEFKDKSALRVTKDHPLYTENGYLKVENLKVGDKIGRINGDKLEFVKITKIKKSLFKETVYNLEVDEYHNYFANGFLAHNKENACDKAPDNAGIKKNYPCGTCKLCYDGSCVNIAAGKDLNNECLAEGCLTGLCSGSGYCAYYTSGQQACYYGMVCDSSGKCVVDPNTNTLGAVQGETRLIVNNKNISFKEAAILTSKIGTCLNYPRQTCQSNEDCQITDFECLPMLRCSNNLTVTCDDDSDCISGESVCEGANVPAIYGSQNESVIIEADITLKPDAYLIFGDQLLFNGGKIILDGGAILRAGSMIQSGGGQGRRACACVYSSLENENYSFRSSGILTLSSGQGLCDDSIVCEEGTELLDNSSIDEQWVFKSETKKVDWDGIPFDWVEGVRYKKFSKYDKYSNNDCPSDCDKFYWRPKEDPESGEIIWYYYMCCSGIGPYGLSGCGGGEAVDRCWYDPYLPQLAPTTMPFYGWQ
ncbi:MAG: polymorphic toxin-type HINT domain-containing protein [Candidatus Marinimicrobia bacterium]|nr:polymorphic toxin-type HINT domain-containing protein [Candidatus Neomarinimicrobiota bacterium]